LTDFVRTAHDSRQRASRSARKKREAAERAVATHESRCPAATSVRGCIPIEITSEIVEE